MVKWGNVYPGRSLNITALLHWMRKARMSAAANSTPHPYQKYAQWQRWRVLDAVAELRNVTIWFLTNARPSAWNSYAPTGRIFTKFDIWDFWGENLSTEITFQSNLTRIAETLYDDLCTCMKTPRWMLLEMFHTKVEEKIKTHILCSITLFQKIVPFMR
jgi:hypothetical protein